MYDLAAKFSPLVASWLPIKKVNIEPCYVRLEKSLSLSRKLFWNVGDESVRRPHFSQLCFLLRSHQALQQTNFGRLCDQSGLPAPEARLI